MTTCKSWCGKDYMDDEVPHQNIARGTVFMANPGLPGDLVNVEQPAYCSQACLYRATAKPATSAPDMAQCPSCSSQVKGGAFPFKFNCARCALGSTDGYNWVSFESSLTSPVKECGKDIGGASEGIACNKAEGHYGSCQWHMGRGPRRMVAPTAPAWKCPGRPDGTPCATPELSMADAGPRVGGLRMCKGCHSDHWHMKTAPERKLAKGWVKLSTPGRLDRPLGPYSIGEVWNCYETARCRNPASYAAFVPGDVRKHKGACEAHAAEIGVWEPMVTVEYTGGGTTSTGVIEGPLQPIPLASMDRAAYEGLQEQCDAIQRRLLGLPDKPLKWVGPKPTFEMRGEQIVAVASKCPTCTHRHVGPCNGTSPNGEFACPCGHERVEAKREVKAVGTYGNLQPWSNSATVEKMEYRDHIKGHTATLLANLERERVPGRRPIRTVRRYEGNGDE